MSVKCGGLILLQNIPTCAQDCAELWGDRYRWERGLSQWFAFHRWTL